MSASGLFLKFCQAYTRTRAFTNVGFGAFHTRLYRSFAGNCNFPGVYHKDESPLFARWRYQRTTISPIEGGSVALLCQNFSCKRYMSPGSKVNGLFFTNRVNIII